MYNVKSNCGDYTLYMFRTVSEYGYLTPVIFSNASISDRFSEGQCIQLNYLHEKSPWGKVINRLKQLSQYKNISKHYAALYVFTNYSNEIYFDNESDDDNENNQLELLLKTHCEYIRKRIEIICNGLKDNIPNTISLIISQYDLNNYTSPWVSKQAVYESTNSLSLSSKGGKGLVNIQKCINDNYYQVNQR